jgi:hypothetical protein
MQKNEVQQQNSVTAAEGRRKSAYLQEALRAACLNSMVMTPRIKQEQHARSRKSNVVVLGW